MNHVSTAKSPWLRCFRVREGATVRLVLFPHAGGSANFYREWVHALPEACELWVVQYPGRENRMAEPLVPRLEDLADGAAAAIHDHLRPPYALFGHSMGALVAYEAARRTAAGPLGGPVRLFASARAAPGRERGDGGGAPVHRQSDADLAALIEGLGATPSGVLADPEIRALVLPMVRHDYRLVETYRPALAAALDTPITALAGCDDPTIAPERVKEWAELTTRDFAIDVLPGDHFFPVRHRAETLAVLRRDLAAHLAP